MQPLTAPPIQSNTSGFFHESNARIIMWPGRSILNAWKGGGWRVQVYFSSIFFLHRNIQFTEFFTRRVERNTKQHHQWMTRCRLECFEGPNACSLPLRVIVVAICNQLISQKVMSNYKNISQTITTIENHFHLVPPESSMEVTKT